MRKLLFVTGMSRSGTTLLQKMLDAHPTMEVMSQPFPLVYRQVKKDFFEFIGIPSTKYVLPDLFNETRYSRKEFEDFLGGYSITLAKLQTVFDEMKDWSGQQVKPKSLDFLTLATRETGFDRIYSELLDGMSLPENGEVLGSKEILTEEFVSYLLRNGLKVIHIYRDPRDVLSSINFGKGTHYVGDHRPTLFHLRNWRKSIAVRNTFLKEPSFLSVSYEALTKNHESVLSEICKFLEVESFPDSGQFRSKIPVGEEQWQGNSSQDTKAGVNESSVGRYRQLLSEDMIRYVEYICYPEMKLLGYSMNSERTKINYDPAGFIEPFDIDSESSGIDPSFSVSEVQLILEKERRNLLTSKDAVRNEIERFFYSVENHLMLSKAVLQ